MSSIPLCTTSSLSTSQTPSSPLPHLLQTPNGLAILEIQGTLNFPSPENTDKDSVTPIGSLIFPLYDSQNKEDPAWMKKVYLYVGKNQRLTGEVKKLAKPLGVIGKREGHGENGMDVDGENGGSGEELEIMEIVRYKILFGSRPEPVGD